MLISPFIITYLLVFYHWNFVYHSNWWMLASKMEISFWRISEVSWVPSPLASDSMPRRLNVPSPRTSAQPMVPEHVALPLAWRKGQIRSTSSPLRARRHLCKKEWVLLEREREIYIYRALPMRDPFFCSFLGIDHLTNFSITKSNLHRSVRWAIWVDHFYKFSENLVIVKSSKWGIYF